MVGIQQNQERIIHNPVPTVVYFFYRIPGQTDPQTPSETIIPVFIRHLLAVRPKPRQILHFRAADPPSLEKLAPM